MGVRTWHYLMGDDGVARRVTQKIVGEMQRSDGKMPEHALHCRKMIVVEIETNGREPPFFVQAVGRYWDFDARGSLKAHFWQEQADVIDMLPGAMGSGPKAQAKQDAMRREIVERRVWQPTDDDMEAVVQDIWRMPLNRWRTLSFEVPTRH